MNKASASSRQKKLSLVRETLEQEYPLASASPRNLAIDVRDLTLSYPIGAYHRGSVKSAMLSLFGHRDATPKPVYVEALRKLSFSITYGERVGLIGHNGSGKSTLLRALAGIYPIASGDVSIVGRIGTLLEVGLGFEAESTGRENIYYRGMTLGFSRKQLAEMEPEIVAFADLGDFIDMPVRTYSAGMFVRLGFAISTQFAPEILLVDEVFGAGDASFAQKAVQRMLSIVERSGIFVLATHDVALIERVCTRVIWLDRGQIEMDGPPVEVLPAYKQAMTG